MKLIGVTGGIGSGKTTICEYIERLGYDVYYSDVVANRLVKTNSKLKEELITEFGNEVYINGNYNRQYIADIVFNDKTKLNKINTIFKKYLTEDFDEYAKDKTLIFYESALILELGISDEFDKLICATASPKDIIERIKNRNNFTIEEIKLRLDNQLDPVFKALKSDYVVDTTNLNEAFMVVDAILKHIEHGIYPED